MSSNPSPESTPQTSRQFQLVSAALAFVVWGGWAWFVNSQSTDFSLASPWVSGLVQGTASCVITLFMLQAVTRLFRRLQGNPLRLILPAIITTCFTGTCITMAHVVARTADVPATVVPGLVVAFCFNIFTAMKLSQFAKANENSTLE